MIENPRIQRLKEKLMGYNFRAEWKSGKQHFMPDALSRAPVWIPKADDLIAEEATCQVKSLIIYKITTADNTEESVKVDHLQDSILENLKLCAEKDEIYQKLSSYIKNGFPKARRQLEQQIQMYWNVKYELSYEDGLILRGCQIVIPKQARKQILQRLHDSHQGIVHTKRRARQTVFWPGMSSDIKNTIEACEMCQISRPSLPKEEMLFDPIPSRPFEDVSSDLFSCGGKHFMVYADRLSGWPFVCQFGNSDPTSKKVICALRQIFSDTGVPVRFRSDNGPQYKSHEFLEFLRRWNINCCPSTPYYPQSNGHAEASVKEMKSLIMKCMVGGHLDEDKYYAGLLEWRNTPNVSGKSPSEILFGRPLRSLVPAHKKSFDIKWKEIDDACDKKEAERNKSMERYNHNAKNLPVLEIGNKVRIQNAISKRWDTIGEIVEIGDNRKYTIKMPSGKILTRNRKFLKKINDALIPKGEEKNEDDEN